MGGVREKAEWNETMRKNLRRRMRLPRRKQIKNGTFRWFLIIQKYYVEGAPQKSSFHWRPGERPFSCSLLDSFCFSPPCKISVSPGSWPQSMIINPSFCVVSFQSSVCSSQFNKHSLRNYYMPSRSWALGAKRWERLCPHRASSLHTLLKPLPLLGWSSSSSWARLPPLLDHELPEHRNHTHRNLASTVAQPSDL